MTILRNVIRLLFVVTVLWANPETLRAEGPYGTMWGHIQCELEPEFWECINHYHRKVHCVFDNQSAFEWDPWRYQECYEDAPIPGGGDMTSAETEAGWACETFNGTAVVVDFACGGSTAPVAGSYYCEWDESEPCDG